MIRNRGGRMSPGGHLVTTLAACGATAVVTGSLTLTVGVAAGGFLIDVDHAVDYVFFDRQRDLRPGAFLRYYLEGRVQRAVLVLHSYELFALLGCPRVVARDSLARGLSARRADAPRPRHRLQRKAHAVQHLGLLQLHVPRPPPLRGRRSARIGRYEPDGPPHSGRPSSAAPELGPKRPSTETAERPAVHANSQPGISATTRSSFS